MKHLFAILFLCAALASFGQETNSDSALDFSVVDKYPVYHYCDSTGTNEQIFNCMTSEIMRFISQNFYYPKEARENNIQGRVYVTFVVEKDGSISNVSVVRGVHESLDKEAARVINSMPTFDKPAFLDGKRVRMQYTVPINARLSGGEEKKSEKKKRKG